MANTPVIEEIGGRSDDTFREGLTRLTEGSIFPCATVVRNS
jgi:hypothetical protein